MIENFKLHVFRVVADTLSFSKAAEELHLSQPAVTSQVRTLEEGLGIALFDRIGRNAKLTPAGTTLLGFVRQIETLTNEAVAALAPYGVQEGAELNIGASHTIAVYVLPKLLPQILRDWPKLRVHVVSGSTIEVLTALANHQVSLGLIEAPAHRPDFKIEPFMEDELCLILPPNHRWAKKAILRAPEIVQEPILLQSLGRGCVDLSKNTWKRTVSSVNSWRTTVDMNSTEAILSAVEAGLGIGFVPTMALGKALQAKSVVAISLENGPIKRQFSIAMLGGPVTAGPVRDLLALLRLVSPPSTGLPRNKALRGKRP